VAFRELTEAGQGEEREDINLDFKSWILDP